MKIIGIVDCSVESNLVSVYESFVKQSKIIISNWPNSLFSLLSIPQLCFAFEMLPDQADPELNEFKIIPDQDLEHLNFYLSNILVQDVLMTWFKQCVQINSPNLKILCDNLLEMLSNSAINDSNVLSYTRPSNDNESPRNRIVIARIYKLQADYCLLSGAYDLAEEKYIKAIENLKHQSDVEFKGAAIEGLTFLFILRSKMDLNSYQEAIKKQRAALECYSHAKTTSLICIEPHLRLAELILKVGDKIEMDQQLSTCYANWLSLNQPKLANISILKQLIFLYREAKLYRKAGYFVWELARLACQEMIPASKMHLVLLQVYDVYGIQFNSSRHPNDLFSCHHYEFNRNQMISPGRWTTLQASLASFLIYFSIQSGEYVDALKCMLYMLREIVPNIKDVDDLFPVELKESFKDFNELFKQIILMVSSSISPTLQDIPYNGFKLVKNIQPVPDASIQVRLSRSIQDPIFLYRSNRKAEELELASNYIFTWAEHASYFDLELASNYTQVLENLHIELKALVVTPQNYNHYKVNWNPEITFKSTPVNDNFKIYLSPKGISFILQVITPHLENTDTINGNDFILLCPEYLHYSINGLALCESLIDHTNSSIQMQFKKMLRYLEYIPQLSARNENRWPHPMPPVGIRQPFSSRSDKDCKPIHKDAVMLELLDGQVLETRLILKNESSDLTIDYLDILFYENHQQILFTNGKNHVSNSSFVMSRYHLQLVIDTIKANLPLHPQQIITIPLHFQARKVGLFQFSIRFESKNIRSKPQFWNVTSTDWSFNIVESLQVISISCFESEKAILISEKSLACSLNFGPSFDKISQVQDKEKLVQDFFFDCCDNYMLVCVLIKNKAKLSFGLTYYYSPSGHNDQKRSLNRMVHPMSDSSIYLPMHLGELSEYINNVLQPSRLNQVEQEVKVKERIAQMLEIHWLSSANRCGFLPIPSHKINLDLNQIYLREYRVQLDLLLINNVDCNDQEGSTRGSLIKKHATTLSKIEPFQIICHQICTIQISIEPRCDLRGKSNFSYLSLLCYGKYARVREHFFWIGKSENLDLDLLNQQVEKDSEYSIQSCPRIKLIKRGLVILKPGVYNVIAQLHDLERSRKIWSQPILICARPSG